MDGKEQEVLQKHLAKFIIGDVFNGITEDDILKETATGTWLWKGKELDQATVIKLKDQAAGLHDSLLWKILKSELIWNAQLRGLVKSQTEADLIASKLILYLTKVIDEKLESMAK